MSKVTLQGKPVDILGLLPRVGDKIAKLAFTGGDLNEVQLDSYKGKRKILNVFPSIDTPTCAASVKAFNEAASHLDNTVVLCISADLPFAQGRFCGAEGLENVETLSTFRHPDVHEKIGVDITSLPLKGLCARAVIVIDENDKVLYSELVGEIADEPHYDAALAALS